MSPAQAARKAGAAAAKSLFFTTTQRPGKLSGLMEKVNPMDKVSDNFGVEGAR
jgi:hypothetical protein